MLLKNFEDQVLKFLKIENLDSAKKQEFLNGFSEFVNNVVLDFILQNLNDLDAKDFLILLEQDASGTKGFQFAKEKITDFDKKILELVKKEINGLQL